jgi:3-dehydroquinate dehydratase/shikimate dehydrogenase
MDEMRRARDEAAAFADLIEVRLDSTRDPDPAGALQGRTRPVIVTCRPVWEGGAFDGDEESRIALLRRAWTLGAEFVDIEARAEAAGALLTLTEGRRLVLSSHDFAGVPSDLEDRVREMARTAADIVKIAGRATCLRDALAVLRCGHALNGRRHVALAMGTPGMPTRILASRSNSEWTYAGDGWAPGQLPAQVLLELYRFRQIGPATAVYGVLGRPIGHSLSPALHNAAFAAAGMDAVYLPLEADSADDAIAFLDGIGMAGASVTAPYKLSLMPHVTRDDAVARVGALNTLRRAGEGWDATNTDVPGFLAPLRSRLSLGGTRAAILGTGGAARAAALALSDAGARVTIHGRDRLRAQAVAESVGAAAASFAPPPGSWDLLVNATPVGMAPAVNDSPLPDGPFDGALVYDLVYNPPRTRLLADAERAGCAVLGGLDMLVAQAEAQQHWWTGRTPAVGVMRLAAERAVAGDVAPVGSRPFAVEQ